MPFLFVFSVAVVFCFGCFFCCVLLFCFVFYIGIVTANRTLHWSYLSSTFKVHHRKDGWRFCINWSNLHWLAKMMVTREPSEQFCRLFSTTWRPVTVHVWEFAFQIGRRPVMTMFCWLCMFRQDFSPFRPGTDFMSTQWWTWWVAGFDWSFFFPTPLGFRQVV